MTIYKLEMHKYANCGYYRSSYLAHGAGWCQESGFISYNTKVIIMRGARVLYTGKYSRTTSRQLTWWLDEYGECIKGLNEKTLELMNKKHLAYNYITGELEPLTKEEEREIKEIRKATFNYGYGW